MNWKEIGLTVSIKWYSKNKKYSEIKQTCQCNLLLASGLRPLAAGASWQFS
jgi:hypothetical protein